MTIEERQRKFADFEVFAREAKGIFTKLAGADPSHQQLDEQFQFHISPGGVTGVDRKSVQIHYGQRAVDASESLDENLRVRIRLEAEVGAGLLYKRTVNGGVNCLLYPASTETEPTDEEVLFLEWLDDPTKLTQKAQDHWLALVAFMHCTSLDGEPTRSQRFRTWRLRSFRPRFVDGTKRLSKAMSLVLDVVKFVSKVGLSGFLLALLLQIESCGREERQLTQFEAIHERLSQVGARMQEVLAELHVQSQLMREQHSTSLTLISRIDSTEGRGRILSTVRTRKDSVAD